MQTLRLCDSVAVSLSQRSTADFWPPLVHDQPLLSEILQESTCWVILTKSPDRELEEPL